MNPFTIHTNNRELLIAVLPNEDSEDFEIIRNQDNYDQSQLKLPSDKFRGLQNYSCIDLPEGNWQIVGPIKREGDSWEFGFDPDPYVKSWIIMDRIGPTKCYENGVTKYESFISLIKSTKELYFQNPLGEKETFPQKVNGKAIVNSRDVHDYEKYISVWQSYEDKVIKDHQILVLENLNK